MDSCTASFNKFAGENMLSNRMRSTRIHPDETSYRNAKWNIIDDNNDENDSAIGAIGRGFNPSRASLIRPRITKLKASSLSKKGSLDFSKLSLSSSSSPVLRKNPTGSKYSYKLRTILRSDLKLGGGIPSKPRTTQHPRTVSPSIHRRKMRKTNSLHEKFSDDMASLLKTLHSNEFVGTIHPQYHATYVSDQSF